MRAVTLRIYLNWFYYYSPTKVISELTLLGDLKLGNFAVHTRGDVFACQLSKHGRTNSKGSKFNSPSSHVTSKVRPSNHLFFNTISVEDTSFGAAVRFA